MITRDELAMWVELAVQDVEYRVAADVQASRDLLLSGECLDAYAPLTEPTDEAA